MNVIEFKTFPSSAEKNELIERITQLGEEQSLILRTPISVELLLEEIKKKRFQGLSWSSKAGPTLWEVEIKNMGQEDCCGCCGGH